MQATQWSEIPNLSKLGSRGELLKWLMLQVDLPIDPTIVLLDIGFTGTDPNHGAPLMRLDMGTRCDMVGSMACQAHSCFAKQAAGTQQTPGLGPTGFLLGSRQTLLETKDGGKTWEPRTVAAAQVRCP